MEGEFAKTMQLPMLEFFQDARMLLLKQVLFQQAKLYL